MILTCHQAAFAASAETYFKAGKLAFSQKKYNKAIELFQKSLLKGLQTPAVYHNLGVAAYKAKNYSKAKIAFKENLKNANWKSLAQYNLGLIAQKQGRKKAATKWFTLASNDSSNKTIQKAAFIVLSRMNKGSQIKSKVNTSKQWFLLTQAGTGIEDNTLDLGQGDTQTGEDNQFLEFTLFANKSFGTADKGYNLNSSFYTSVNTVFSHANELNNNLYLMSAGFDRHVRFNQSWSRSTGLNSYYSLYQDQAFQNIVSSHLKLQRTSKRNNRLQFRIQYQYINSLNDQFNYLAGHQWNFRSEFERKKITHRFRLYYDFESNARRDDENLSYSPQRHRVYSEITFKNNKKFEHKLSLDLRASNYPDLGTSISRTDNRFQLIWKTGYKLKTNLFLNAQYSYQKQNSPLENYDYHRQRFTTGIEFIL